LLIDLLLDRRIDRGQLLLSKTCGHMARLGKARLGYDPAAIGGPPRAARREAAARREVARVGRAAWDRVDVALARLPVHSRGELRSGDVCRTLDRHRSAVGAGILA